MKFLKLIFSSISILLSSFGDNNNVYYKKISPKDAKQMLSENKGTLILDVRTREEYVEGHIPGSILIPVDKIKNEAPSKLQNIDSSIIVYCRSGARSTKASTELGSMGYTNVYNMGGIFDWKFEIEKGQPK